jgi:isopentenyl diphosphate isomerase/L-lactate dehydrogenase-like FMN-dependent dehydrogenase
MSHKSSFELRRRLLQFMAASPIAYGASAIAQRVDFPYAPQFIENAEDAINVFDFHEVAKSKLSPGHYTYMARGADHGQTMLANRQDFKKLKLRMRRLIDVRNIDTSITLFGKRYSSPIFLAPCGRQGIYHPEAEIAVARAVKKHKAEFILSTVGSSAIEDVNKAAGRPVWFQLYPDSNWEVTTRLVKRVESSGCPVLVLTVDMPATNREALDRYHRKTNPDCQGCHSPKAGVLGKKPMLEGLGQKSRGKGGEFMDWAFVKRLKASTSMKLVLKGIVTHEDAKLALANGVDGVIVSNHGGRAEDSGRSTIDALPEVVEAIQGKIPVIFDGGIRRGTDIFKALALGADAIAIGQPYLWGLSFFGQQGVESVITLLKKELGIVMKQARTTHIAQVNNNYIV